MKGIETAVALATTLQTELPVHLEKKLILKNKIIKPDGSWEELAREKINQTVRRRYKKLPNISETINDHVFFSNSCVKVL